MEVKLLRLFGRDLNPLEGFQEGRTEDPTGEVPCQTEQNADPKSSGCERQDKMYECEFCFKKFKNSQALGGHQNAHKKERLKKRRLRLQEKAQNCSIHHTFLPFSGYFSPSGPHFEPCKESVISFNTLHNHNRNANMDAVFAIAGFECRTREECKRPLVVKPSPSDVPKDCQIPSYMEAGVAAENGRDDWCGAVRRI